MTAARHHHYVPQCYLRGFARHRDKPKLFVVDARRRAAFTTSPANVAQERDFHRVDLDGHPIDAVESALSGFEGGLGPALERIIASESVANPQEFNFVLNLIALLAVKNPAQRENIRAFSERVMKQVLDAATATPERWASQVERMVADGRAPRHETLSYDEVRDFVRRDA